MNKRLEKKPVSMEESLINWSALIVKAYKLPPKKVAS